MYVYNIIDFQTWLNKTLKSDGRFVFISANIYFENSINKYFIEFLFNDKMSKIRFIDFCNLSNLDIYNSTFELLDSLYYDKERVVFLLAPFLCNFTRSIESDLVFIPDKNNIDIFSSVVKFPIEYELT